MEKVKEKQTILTKAISIFAAAALAAAALAGCSQYNSKSGSAASSNNPTPTKDEIKIDQIDWNVDSAIYDGDRRVVFEYTNNSDYSIASVKFQFRLNAEAAEEEVNTAYQSLYGWDSSNDYERLGENGIWCAVEGMVAPGETSNQARLEAGITYLTDIAQYELTAPDIAEIVYLKDGNLYTETYDFLNDKYSLSNDIQKYISWPDNTLAQAIPSLEGKYLTNIFENERSINFDVEGISSSEYKDYTSECRAAGYLDKSPGDSYYNADSDDGKYELSLIYSSDNQILDITVRLNDGFTIDGASSDSGSSSSNS